MFCPKCGAQNQPEQKFCRQCGLALTNVQRVLDGSLDELLEKAKLGGDKLAGSAVNFLIFSAIAFLCVVLSSGRSFTAAVNLLLGFLFGIPALYKGIKAVKAIEKMLDGKEAKRELAAPANKPLATAAQTAPSLSLPSEPASVTEHTTYKLQ